jgi:hypothetical protein
MPIRARSSKSGEKNVFKKNRSKIGSRLNRAARTINRGEARELTPGVVTELFDQRSKRSAARKQTAVLQNRRRRH